MGDAELERIKEAPVAPFSPVLVSDKYSWQRWTIIALLLVVIAVQVIAIMQTNENQTIGDGNRDVLCALTVDDARNDSAVREVYERFCGTLPS